MHLARLMKYLNNVCLGTTSEYSIDAITSQLKIHWNHNQLNHLVANIKLARSSDHV